MQCGLHHRITANGHGRMCPASPITILFMTCETERITAAKRRAAIVTALMLARVANPVTPVIAPGSGFRRTSTSPQAGSGTEIAAGRSFKNGWM
jgi:hypothetical protein